MKTTAKIIALAAGTAIFSSALTAVAVSSLTGSAFTPSASTQASNNGQFYTVSSAVTPATDFTKAAESTINGVVSIKSFATPRGYQQGGGFMDDPFFEYFFGSPRQQQRQQQAPQREQQRGLGSGVIISADGYIVTNNHVIDEAERLEVTLNDNRTFDATVIGADPTTDLALIKIDAKDLPVIPMGDSEQLKVGEWVLAVGNPFGFTSTVTTGIVSAKSRSISSAAHSRPMGIESYIQTDAAVNPGNSGGALVTLNGELIGINTAIYSQTGNYAGYSFAIPTSIVKKVVSDLRQYGSVQRAVLGVSITDLTAETAKEHGITAVTKGVYVAGVSERSSAREAGIKEGDVITAINDTPTNNTAELQEQVAKYRPGDKITVAYIRDNKQHTVDIKLLNSQGNTTVTKAGDFADLGCAFAKPDASQLKQLGIDNGVRVADVKDGVFADAGVRKGFIIVSINDTRVSTPEDVEKIYRSIMRGQSDEKVMILRGVYPTGRRGIYAVDLTAQ
ncbi:MAG: Do family serine endopeptidase [Muribaculaceae bacterium]|nr:Do family serine endopeptidase [Muribaculaceae bacterium]